MRIPWISFLEQFDFVLKNFFYNHCFISLVRSLDDNYYLLYNNFSYFLHNNLILDYDTLFTYKTAFTFENIYNYNLNYNFTFIKFLLKQNYLIFFLPFVYLIQNQINFYNDFFFFSQHTFFEILFQKNVLANSRKPGRPKKIELDYFESETDMFGNLNFFAQLNLIIF